MKQYLIDSVFSASGKLRVESRHCTDGKSPRYKMDLYTAWQAGLGPVCQTALEFRYLDGPELKCEQEAIQSGCIRSSSNIALSSGTKFRTVGSTLFCTLAVIALMSPAACGGGGGGGGLPTTPREGAERLPPIPPLSQRRR